MKLFKSMTIVLLSTQLSFGATITIADRVDGDGALIDADAVEASAYTQQSDNVSAAHYILSTAVNTDDTEAAAETNAGATGYQNIVSQTNKRFLQSPAASASSSSVQSVTLTAQNEAMCPAKLNSPGNEGTTVSLFNGVLPVLDIQSGCTNRLRISYVQEADRDTKFNDFCGCVFKNNNESGNYPVTKEGVYRELNRKYRDPVMANKVGQFLTKLKSLIRIQAREIVKSPGGYQLSDFSDSACSPKKVASKLSKCFSNEATKIIDDSYNLASGNAITEFFKSREATAENRIKQVFEDSIDKLNKSTYREERGEERMQKQEKFVNLFVSKFMFKDFKNPDVVKEVFNTSYLAQIEEYVLSNPEIREDYTMFIATESQKLKKAPGEEVFLTSEMKAILNGQFALTIHKSIIDNVGSLGNERFKQFIDDVRVTTDEDASEDKRRSALRNVAHLGLKNYRDTANRLSLENCEAELDKLEFACDESNANEFFHNNVSLNDFIGSVGVGDDNTEVPIEASGLYCHAVEIGAVDKSVAINENLTPATSFSSLSSERIFNKKINISNISDSKAGASAYSGVDGASNAANIINGDIAGENIDGVLSTGTDAETYNFDKAANMFDSMSKSGGSMFSDSSVIDSDSLASMVSSPSTTAEDMGQVKSRVEDKLEEVEGEISRNERSNAISTEQLKENEELKSELAALKEQLAQINSAISEKSKEGSVVDSAPQEATSEERQASRTNPAVFSGSSRRDSSYSPAPTRAQAAASAAVSVPTASSIGSAISSAGAGVSGISKLGATGGLGFTATTSSASVGGRISGESIAKVDQSLVAKAISEGSNIVVLADGRVYYIGQDEDGNVVLSESAEEVLAGVVGPEEEGPQLPDEVAKPEGAASREIASEPEENSGEDSIYSKFLNAAEIDE